MAEKPASAQEPTPSTIQHSRVVNATPVYYGWVVIVVGILARIMSSPGQTYAVSVFIEHYIRDLGLSRGMVSTLYTVGTLVASFTLPFVGRKIDQRGPRLVMAWVVVAFSAACFYMGSVRNAAMLLLGFFLLRMLGQGSLGMVAGNLVNNWWVRRRGTVLGLSAVASSLLGSGLAPAFMLMLIARYGWRLSYPIMGGMLMLVMLPAALIFVRRRPEDYGLLPDGLKSRAGSEVGSATAAAEPLEENWTREEAIRTPAFWILGMGLASISMLGTGLQFHMFSVFADSGLSETAAAAVFLPIAATVAVVSVVGGVLIDRVPARYLLFVALLGQVASLLLAPRLALLPSVQIYGLVLGITSGLQQTVSQVIWPNYFGRQHLGAIQGVATLVGIAGSALGPMPMGVARDLLGGYGSALTVLAILPALLAILALFARRPRRAMAS